jgi:hypothetical protein
MIEQLTSRPGASRALAAICAAATVAGPGALPASATPRNGVSRAARVVHADENASLHQVSSEGSQIVEEGSVSGSFAGTVKGSFNVGPTVTGSVTMYVSGGGSFHGHGYGTLHNAYGHVYESFGGTVTVTGGTGRFKGAHGRVEFYGAINRRTYAMQVQTRGTLYF